MNSSVLRSLSCMAALLICGAATAAGLGELRRHPVLGESLRLQIELVNVGRQLPDASCFALKEPAAGGRLFWLKEAQLKVRPGNPALLEIEAPVSLREPAVQLAVELGCGSHVRREYTVLVSPRRNPKGEEPFEASRLRLGEAEAAVPPVPKPRVPRPAPARPPAAAAPAVPPVAQTVPPAPVAPAVAPATETRNEVVPSAATGSMAPAGSAAPESTAATPPAAPAEGAPTPAAMPAAPVPETVPATPAPTAAAPVPPAPAEETPWGLYLTVLFGLLGVGGAFAYRYWRERRGRVENELLALTAGAGSGSTTRLRDVLDEEGGDRHAYTLVEEGAHEPVEATLGTSQAAASAEAAAAPSAETAPDAAFPALDLPPLVDPLAAQATPAVAVEEALSVNPVMELADIMLSFGRVKGAAQALQEYIDRNPQEALQPWIRLLDVYRLAGMREEFEAVARNLNQTFNVELMTWDEMEAAAAASADTASAPVAESRPESNIIEFTLDPVAAPAAVSPPVTRPQSLEDMPRVISMIIERWPDDGVIELMHELLRDNRGGTRLGFARPVVEELLFLIELRENMRRIAA